MLNPNSAFRRNWDIAQAVLLGYIATTVPYRVGFDDNVPLWSFYFFLDMCIDLYFYVDLGMNFRTAVITPHGDILYLQVCKDRIAFVSPWIHADAALLRRSHVFAERHSEVLFQRLVHGRFCGLYAFRVR